MQMKTLRKLTSVLLAVMLVVSMCVIGIGSVSAAEESTSTTTLYFSPGDITSGNERYAAYAFGDAGNQWYDPVSEANNVYTFEIDSAYTKIIFCRMNGASTTNGWGNKWDQTYDLALDGVNDLYTITGKESSGQWKLLGEWSVYAETPTDPTEAPSYKYTVAGDAGLCGTEWKPAVAENALTDEDGDGVYEITFTNVPAGSYSFKVTDGTWVNTWGNGTGNYSINLTADADVTIKFTESTKEIEVVSSGLGDFVLNHMTVVGDLGLVGVNWDPKADEGVMTQDENGVWTITFSNVAAGEYEYKFIANDNYTYSWTVDGDFNILGNSTIAVENDGADVTLTIDVSGFDFATSEGSVVATATATGGTPTEPTDPVAKEYCLFGTINGADYGCGDDWKTIGDYVFVDGKLTATFDSISYVAVKTTDNASWFMTDDWQGTVKEVTLYNTSVLGETANKLIVPAGEVRFTLTENADGTLTLSYESDNEPTIPVDPTEPTEPTEATDPTVVTDPTEPTTAPEPTTTPEPTTEPTTAPVDVPDDGYYVISDSFKLKLATCGTNKMSGTIALQAGSYQFKLDNFGTLLGYKKTVNDYTTSGMTFQSRYSSSSTLVATGGKYTFQVNTDTNTLVIKYDSNLPNEYLIGDLNTILSPVDGKPLSIGSTYLAAGTYKFKLSIGNVEFGYGKTVTDSTPGALSFNNKYSSSCTLIATGGNYTFTLNTSTNKLIINHIPAKAEATDDVHLSGDIDLVLDDNGGESNIATGSITLAEGTYTFKVYSYGVGYTAGAKIADSATKNLKSTNVTPVTLIASGGTYDFSFNKTTGQLTVKMV